ncbi:MAG: DUF3786 domain-containing protein [Anaerolineae bacterium]
MSQLDPNRRFQLAYDHAVADWAVADPARRAALAGCILTPAGVLVPYFGRPHVVTHPAGTALVQETGKPAHITIAIVLIHYLLKADGTPLADRWLAFRQLPDGMFYAQAFANHAEGPLAERFGNDVDGFRQAALALGGTELTSGPAGGLAPPDAFFRFQALPWLALAVQLWGGDEEFPGRARILFDAHAGHYLPTEDLAGLGDWLAHKLIHFSKR